MSPSETVWVCFDCGLKLTFHHSNLHRLMVQNVLIFSLFTFSFSLSLPFPFFPLVPFFHFVSPLDSISTGRCQKISPSQHTQERSVSNLPQSQHIKVSPSQHTHPLGGICSDLMWWIVFRLAAACVSLMSCAPLAVQLCHNTLKSSSNCYSQMTWITTQTKATKK